MSEAYAWGFEFVYGGDVITGSLSGNVTADGIPYANALVFIYRHREGLFPTGAALIEIVVPSSDGSWEVTGLKQLPGMKFASLATDLSGGFDPVVKINLEAEPY